MTPLFEFCNERKIESGTSELKLDFLCGGPTTVQEKVDKAEIYVGRMRMMKGMWKARGTETVVTNIAIKLNIHRFQKKSKRAEKNIGLFRTFFVLVYIVHFKSYHDCNRLETFY